jgi:hypothetical protein
MLKSNPLPGFVSGVDILDFDTRVFLLLVISQQSSDRHGK